MEEHKSLRFTDHLRAFGAAVLAAGEKAAKEVFAYLTSADGIAHIIGAAATVTKAAQPNIVKALPPAVQEAASAVLDATRAELDARRGSGFEKNVHLAFQEHVLPVLTAGGISAPKASRSTATA